MGGVPWEWQRARLVCRGWREEDGMSLVVGEGHTGFTPSNTRHTNSYVHALTHREKALFYYILPSYIFSNDKRRHSSVVALLQHKATFFLIFLRALPIFHRNFVHFKKHTVVFFFHVI